MVINKYLAGLLTVAVVFITALQAALVNGLTVTEAWQLAGLFVGAFVTTFVPLLESGWAGALKVIGAVIGALIAAIVPFVTSEWTAETVTVVILAAVNTLAVQLGVNVRIDSARSILADPHTSDDRIIAIDPKAAAAAEQIVKQKIA